MCIPEIFKVCLVICIVELVDKSIKRQLRNIAHDAYYNCYA